MTEVLDIPEDVLDGLVEEVSAETVNADLERIAAETAKECGLGVKVEKSAAFLETQGWKGWLKTLGPRTFTGPFAFYHTELWDWYWAVTEKRRRGERLSLEDLVALAVWGRGGGKSSCIEWACIAEGALLGKGYVMYVCATESQARDHVAAIKGRLESEEIAKYYPGLTNPEISKHGFRRGWNQEYLATASGWGIIPVGLDEGVRGGRKDDMRFTMIILDDIDDFKDSPTLVEKKINTITRSILPAGTEDTIILFPQNLIHENSVLNQIYRRRSDALSTRKVFGPYPTFKELNLELTQREDGARVWDIQACIPNWEALDILSARKYLSKFGRSAFLAEYQHDFESNKEGRVLRNYNDKLMVIPRSLFKRVYGVDKIPDNWNKRVFHDWSRTKSAYHANIAGKLTVSNQNTKLPGKLWLFDLMSFEAGTQADEVGKRILGSISPFVPNTNQTWEELIESSTSRAGLEIYLSDLTRLIEARRDVLAKVIPPLVVPALNAAHYTSFVGSHDQNNDALSVYRRVFGLPFSPVNPGESGGLEWIDHFMLSDRKTPHPFFDDELIDGEYKLGCPGMFILVDDEKYDYPQVSTPDALHDSDLARYQFNNWRMRAAKLTEGGMMEYGPLKMNDDFGQGLQMAMVSGPPSPTPLTYAEQVVEATPIQHRVETMLKSSPNGISLTPEQELTYLLNRKFAEQKIVPRVQSFDDWGNPT